MSSERRFTPPTLHYLARNGMQRFLGQGLLRCDLQLYILKCNCTKVSLTSDFRLPRATIQRSFRWVPKSNYYNVPILVTYSATYGSKSSRPTKTIRCHYETVIGQFVDTPRTNLNPIAYCKTSFFSFSTTSQNSAPIRSHAIKSREFRSLLTVNARGG